MKNFLEYLEHSADKYPHKVAFSDDKDNITYSVLLSKAKAVGSKIAKSVHHQTNLPVIVAANRTIDTIISFLGVLYSGNFYLPIDPKTPIERKKLIFSIINPVATLITLDNTSFLDDINGNQQEIVLDKCMAETVDEGSLWEIRRRMIDTDPIYAIFTSGSTGVPKCVVISHHSVIDFVENFSELFQLSEEMIFGNQAPLDYDGSLKGICLTLRNASTLHILPKMLFSFPKRLFEYLDDKKVNTLIWATSALRIIANHQALGHSTPSYLQKIFFTGEVMPNKVLNYFRKHLPRALFVNLYGPTESTFNCSYYIVDRPFSDDEDLPIGTPFQNTDIILLDSENHAVPKGDMGEICVRGISIAQGYYNDPEATNKAFLQNPLNDHFPERIYRTGDLGYFNDLGELMFVSRMDQQIKHMGYRIELGEIEAAVNALACVEVAVCIHDEDNGKIILFYQAPKTCDTEILIRLQDRLPKYMIPNTLIHYEQLPLKENMKVDRVKVRKAYFDKAH